MEDLRPSGVIILDKPGGMSSARAVAHLKRALKGVKVGHAGTLDPEATGVLVCCVNRATRIARFLLNGPKKYRATLHLGVATDTQDATGSVTSSTDSVAIDPDHLNAVIKQFEGAQWQAPPAYSALKLRGVPLYRYAREGRPVHKAPRRVVIDSIDVIDVEMPFVRLEVSCSAGTYIRTLCADIGRRLGCGGHLKELRRTASSRFTLAEALTLPEIEALGAENRLTGRIIPMADALPDIPGVTANKALTRKIKHGRIVHKFEIDGLQFNGLEGFLKVLDADRNLLAVFSHHHDTETLRYVCVVSGPTAG